MSTPYTDRFGYPLTAAQTLARMQHPKSRGYYDAAGRWIRRPARQAIERAVAIRDGIEARTDLEPQDRA